ncbi:MAG: SGNH/GDSL hydrolase family protein [Proteobacteria bacterium]|jgi:lysophospholipase L1-like esterase|nr:SGNH/GDSL hydrolase family protein [Pseudomonadota bacterium]
MFLSGLERPPIAYFSSYMNGYNYHPYVAFHPKFHPIYGTTTKSSHERKIAILGGSTAAGVGVPDFDKKYFKVLENRLKEKSTSIVNFAVPGYVSNQEHATYKNFLYNRPHPPDIVLSLTSFNDIYFYLFRTLPVGNHEFNYAFDLIFRQGYPPPEKLAEQALNVFRKSATYGFIYKVMNPSIDPLKNPIILSSIIFDPTQPNGEIPTEERLSAVVNNFLGNIRATAILAKSEGTRYIVALQPIYYYGGRLQQGQNEWFHNHKDLERWIKDVGVQKAAYDRFFSQVIPELKKMRSQNLINFFDYRDLLKDSGEVYLDPVHFNEVGAEALAGQMAKDLQKTPN